PALPGGLPGYCPDEAVTRAEMAVFLVKTFGLLLYGPPRTPQTFTVTWAQVPSDCNYLTLNWVFSPATIHVHAGDTVNWAWNGGPHSTTSGVLGPNGIWDSGVQSSPFSFSHTFAETGNFPYYCSRGHVYSYLHCEGGCLCEFELNHRERGSVIVDPEAGFLVKTLGLA